MIPSPKVPHDFPQINLEMNDNVSDIQTINAIRQIEAIVLEINKQTAREEGQKMIRDVLVFNQGRTEAQLLAPLVDEDLRPYNAFELSRRWREAMPNIAGVKSLTIQDDVGGGGGGSGGEFGYLLYGSDIDTLNEAGRRFIGLLQQQEGLFDISSTIDPASKEVQMSLKPVAFDLGLDLASIANQVGASFYGGEAQRVIRRGEEVRVMVRYPKLTREAFSSLKHAVITTPQGREVLLGDVVELTETPGISYIRREGGYRTVYVYGNIDEEVIEPGEVVKQVKENLLPQLLDEYPSVK
jgi:multidrug efflux pump subunit AcrB